MLTTLFLVTWVAPFTIIALLFAIATYIGWKHPEYDATPIDPDTYHKEPPA